MARLIDADAALEAVCYNCMDKYDCPDRCSDYMEVFDIPTVDAVEVVHGRWIVEDADSGEHGCYEAYMIVECSHCGQTHEVETGQFGWVYGEAFPFNFCPNCGAKMDCDGNG